jgi:protein TonB
MELKKNAGIDLRRWSTPLFNFGLMVSVGSVLVAFEWKAKNETPILEFGNQSTDWMHENIPITIQTPPSPPPPLANPTLKILANSEKIQSEPDWTIDIDTDPGIEIPEIKLDGPPSIEKVEEILDFTEVRAEFEGGMEGWYGYLRNNLTFPRQAQKIGLDGTVLVRFVINTDGSVQDVEVVRGVHPLLNQEAIRVIQNSPKWIPGKHQGRQVRTRMTMPIKFKLN